MFREQEKVAIKYSNAIMKIIDDFAKTVKNVEAVAGDIIASFNDYFRSETCKETLNAAINSLAVGVAKVTAKTWREAAAKSNRGREVYRAIEKTKVGLASAIRQIEEASRVEISDLDRITSNAVMDYVAKRQLEGLRAAVIAEELKNVFPSLLASRVQLIARTEVGRAETTLMMARSEAMGVKWFVWRTSEDVRVRMSHRKLDGVLMRFRDPPSPEKLNGEQRDYGPYLPGSIFNCRCLSEPLIDPDDISWPAKCYMAGKVSYLTRARFSQLN